MSAHTSLRFSFSQKILQELLKSRIDYSTTGWVVRTHMRARGQMR